mmetsp:Transcript_27799/g.22993  ORF Transcript_27799/g.22993 Transcript_27799/m.22993 type:complete len:103 (-) Transcript_27799:239-547(-)
MHSSPKERIAIIIHPAAVHEHATVTEHLGEYIIRIPRETVMVSISTAATTLEIEVKPGWKAGTKITFAGEGDELGCSGRCQDVAFVIREKEHPLYQRSGSEA